MNSRYSGCWRKANRSSDIARILSLSQKTIANYQSIIQQKLEADTSAQMVWIALKRGLVTSSSDE